ncbi:MAG TPA: hypothetical protein VF517_00560, partial [Thermoleophilaceae bacterium]
MRIAAADLTRVGPLSPGAKLALALEIVATYARVRRSLRRANVRETLAELRGGGAGGEAARLAAPAPPGGRGSSPTSPIEGARRLGRVVRRTLALLPG